MITDKLYIFETKAEASRAVAELILAKVKEKTKQSLPLNIALSGGSTPKLLFTLLAEEYADSIPWRFLRIFWVDERCVPPTHAESNFGMTYESLLTRVPISENNVFRMQGESDPAAEARRYQALLEAEVPLTMGFPKFDLVLLGMGEDGHTASIFPDDMSLLRSKMAVAVNVHPETGQKRITLTGPTIQQSQQVIFLITGSSKSSTLRQIIHREQFCENYPVFHIATNSESVVFYLDKAAACEI